LSWQRASISLPAAYAGGVLLDRGRGDHGLQAAFPVSAGELVARRVDGALLLGAELAGRLRRLRARAGVDVGLRLVECLAHRARRVAVVGHRRRVLGERPLETLLRFVELLVETVRDALGEVHLRLDRGIAGRLLAAHGLRLGELLERLLVLSRARQIERVVHELPCRVVGLEGLRRRGAECERQGER
jgi:hypothetical protein